MYNTHQRKRGGYYTMSGSKHKGYSFRKDIYDKLMEETLFTDKEKECLKYLSKGLTTKEIGTIMGFSVRNVAKIKRKLRVKLDDYFGIEEEKIYSVYVFIFPNKKVYIGRSSNIKQRWYSVSYKHNSLMYSDIKKYGWENIEKKVLYHNLTAEEAKKKENETIVIYKSYMSEYGYNKAITE